MPRRWTAGAFCMAFGLAGCATGQDSLVAISPSGDVAAEVAVSSDTLFGAASPDLLAVSGTALLPGSRLSRALTPSGQAGALATGLGPAPSPDLVQGATGGLLSRPLVSPEPGFGVQASLPPAVTGPPSPAAAMLSASGTGVQIGVSLSTPTAGPLLSVTGANTRLAGAPVGAAILATSSRPTAGVGANALAIAPTQLAVSATAAAQAPRGGSAPMTGPRLPVSTNPALLAGVTGLLPRVPGSN